MALPNTKDEATKKNRLVIAGGSEQNPGIARPPTANYAELARLQKPVSQSVGEGVGKIARATSNAAIQAGKNIGSVAQDVNMLPGKIAAPIAARIDSFGAAVRSGFTGKNYVGRQFEAQPMFGGGATAQAAPLPVTSPAPAAAPTIAGALAQAPRPADRVATTPTADLATLAQMGVGSMQAQSAPRGFGAATQASQAGNRNYQRLGGDGYDNSNAAVFAKSNRSDGKLNDFAGAGIAGRLPYDQRPENIQNFREATARAAKDKALLTSMTQDRLARETGFAEGPKAEAGIRMETLKTDNTAKDAEARLGIASGTAGLQQKQFESNDAVNQLSVREKTAKLKEQQKVTALRDQIMGMEPTAPGYAKLVSQYNLLTGAKPENVVKMRKVYNEMGQVTGEEPVVVNVASGREVGGDQAKQAAPPGMKQVGTSGGRPVYEDQQGNRFQ